MKNEILIGVGLLVVIIFYIVMRRLIFAASRSHENEIDRILTADEYKVKGRFD
jgi:hypothetical protein